ncbi:hypothetical protein ACRE_004030 [Hapsidospora chrysogenum ATCC 11550]|uniref:Uncharacterized protein n=1 Tax=Hapsidospora chrysogenum (strain ATCC 11550 / CBS 779.69 / DSM 880 / IAM 14645 / JCM 23072 / IMI 49137) TaxID=857340 RepID=A0A086TH84_HAPC1|nr:hypothetical protein ACRE_004030 [Hapsidospora chrysogenum ATCC 11550]
MPFRPPTALRLGATPGAGPARTTRPFHAATTILRAPKEPTGSSTDGVPDALGSASAMGRTGGGEPLESSSSNAPPKPKISNLSVPGTDARKELSEEQKREVDEHNRDFERKHDRGQEAPGDEVDKKYWSGATQGKP